MTGFSINIKSGVPVYCPLPSFVIAALEATRDPGQHFYLWAETEKRQTATGDWQGKLQDLFRRANAEHGHAYRFRDIFAKELLLAGVRLDRASILLRHSSIRITERHHSPWVRSRQQQLERDVRASWVISDPTEGRSEVRGGSGRPN